METNHYKTTAYAIRIGDEWFAGFGGKPAECKRLRGLLDLAYDTIRRKSHNLRFEELKYRSRA